MPFYSIKLIDALSLQLKALLVLGKDYRVIVTSDCHIQAYLYAFKVDLRESAI